MTLRIDLGGKTAVVSGSTAGIGFGIALALARAGARVVINGRSRAAVDAARARIEQECRGAVLAAVPADLGTAAGCAALAAAAPLADVLVNNVGIFGLRDFFETPDEVWQQFLEVNVISGVRLSRAYLPGMAARGWGRVIFVSSESGLNIPPDMVHYGVTKTADLALARGLAKRMAGTGVTVNAILPGPTLSEGVRGMLEAAARVAGVSIEQAAADFIAKHRPSSIIRRAATVEEVANLAVYVASPLSSATTGAALRVDGGVIDTIA
ncbi:MAG TPA: SDR family oxidoreductase [Steroidobacteraceae bacterium]|nr:SDR family oxidoreductase [Steroidobacteraceae bacterium]